VTPRLATVPVVCALVVGLLAPAASAASGAAVLPQAEYRGKDTELQITADGGGVLVLALPVKQKCKGVTPTNLGDFGPSGLGPFTVKKNGSFGNDPGADLEIKGRFKGKKVAGTIKAAAFEDPAKDFDCQKYSGRFSAKLVKGTGLKPGKVLARDDFSDPNSGFGESNTTNGFSEYLDDGRYRIGLRGSTTLSALRETPDALASVEVEAEVLTFGGEPLDEVGLACQAIDAQNFIVGFVQQDGLAKLVRFEGGSVIERSEEVQLPDGVLKSGQGAKNELRLTCRATQGERTDLDLYVNGELAVSATSNSQTEGRTGFSVSGAGNGTDYNFTRYEARIPKQA
jgi:hypothetical protein